MADGYKAREGSGDSGWYLTRPNLDGIVMLSQSEAKLFEFVLNGIAQGRHVAVYTDCSCGRMYCTVDREPEFYDGPTDGI